MDTLTTNLELVHQSQFVLPPLLNQQDIGILVVGERIVNVGGTSIANGNEFVIEMKTRVEGEQLSLTVANNKGKKRIVYVTLGRIPL